VRQTDEHHTMSTYTANLERAADKILEANTTLIEKERTAKRQRLDALNRHAVSVLRTGRETAIADIQNVLTAQFMDDSTMKPSAFGRTNQERYLELVEREAANARRAKLEGMELSEHTAANLHAEVKALELAITHPTSDKALKSNVAKLESILKRLDVAKIFETRIAPLLGVSKRSAERLAAEGRTVWADLIKLATARLVDPDKALPYLSTLPRLLQLEVAHAAERCREEWAIETEIERWARKPKLDHGTLDALPDAQLCNREVRRELSLMDTADRARAITTMRREEREAEREALVADRERRRRAFRSDERFAAASSNASRVTKAVQSYLSLTSAERADIQNVLGLQATNSNQEFAS
jgi:hypothetical protein